jgi:hypothetical protein
MMPAERTPHTTLDSAPVPVTLTDAQLAVIKTAVWPTKRPCVRPV